MILNEGELRQQLQGRGGSRKSCHQQKTSSFGAPKQTNKLGHSPAMEVEAVNQMQRSLKLWADQHAAFARVTHTPLHQEHTHTSKSPLIHWFNMRKVQREPLKSQDPSNQGGLTLWRASRHLRHQLLRRPQGARTEDCCLHTLCSSFFGQFKESFLLSWQDVCRFWTKESLGTLKVFLQMCGPQISLQNGTSGGQFAVDALFCKQALKQNPLLLQHC